MARKYEIISKLAEETAKEVVKNETAWKRYLTTAARIYKYPFQEQLLIYAQRRMRRPVPASKSGTAGN